MLGAAGVPAACAGVGLPVHSSSRSEHPLHFSQKRIGETASAYNLRMRAAYDLTEGSTIPRVTGDTKAYNARRNKWAHDIQQAEAARLRVLHPAHWHTLTLLLHTLAQSVLQLTAFPQLLCCIHTSSSRTLRWSVSEKLNHSAKLPAL